MLLAESAWQGGLAALRFALIREAAAVVHLLVPIRSPQPSNNMLYRILLALALRIQYFCSCETHLCQVSAPSPTGAAFRRKESANAHRAQR